MSRIADAYARAGIRLRGEDPQLWDAAREAAVQHLDERAPRVAIGDGELRVRPRSAPGEAIDVELTTALRRIFLSPQSSVRSVLFCATPGDRMTGVASRAAEILRAQSGQRVAVVEDGTARVSDLYSTFAFVIVHATAPTTDDLLPLAREVDGVIVVIIDRETRRDAAKELVARLTNEARVLGAVFST